MKEERKIILKWTLKQDTNAMDSTGLKQGPVVGFWKTVKHLQ